MTRGEIKKKISEPRGVEVAVMSIMTDMAVSTFPLESRWLVVGVRKAAEGVGVRMSWG